ncbi:Alpha-D-kanosaminyltransferase [Pseudobythopirellula maris]|uniref:Alpha-D-kanosaminyltransferase n=1 Tax=Pseudobythopirellula maris TaxID=2527991 RepID=A0A5C5ZJG8_9BACT|nr:glycosyltransferase [Pseudobythopirellula maris]TWT87532.1 Alpha-D-kanosaminyltransferase [Pseudobythopirellula maris]
MRRPCVFYMAGPGDVIGTYKHWRAGRDDPSQVSVAYSHQFYDVCRQHGYEGMVVSYCSRIDKLREAEFEIEHRPIPFQHRSGGLFHLGRYLFNLSLAWTAIRRRADVAVLMTGSHLAPFWLLRLAGVRVVMTQHCVLWPKLVGPRGVWKVVHAVDRLFFQRGCDAMLSISHDVTEQIDTLTRGKRPQITPFLPNYRRSCFAGARSADWDDEPFRVLFVGRVEEDKGALELVALAELARQRIDRRVVFDVAGDGGAMEELRRRIDAAGLREDVVLHGYCPCDRLESLYAGSHAVLAPTQAGMVEGFNKVVAEAILALRPIVTSEVCPALEVVREAAIEVESNDVEGYFDAIARLAADRELYARKTDACPAYREPFYDTDRSWAAAVGAVLRRLTKPLEAEPQAKVEAGHEGLASVESASG